MSETTKEREVFILSDSTGITAYRAASVALEQFAGVTANFRRYANLVRPEQVRTAFRDAASSGALVVYTLVQKNLREAAIAAAEELNVPVVDIFKDLLPILALWLDLEPHEEAGHRLDAEHYKRMSATVFAQDHDDGQGLHNLHVADIIIVGLSRSSKTPVSHEIARSGFKVANIPLALGTPLPTELLAAHPRRVYVLRMDPECMRQIRSERRSNLGGTDLKLKYAEPSYIAEELGMLDELLAHHKLWTIVRSGGRSVEAIAVEILGKHAQRVFDTKAGKIKAAAI